MSNVLNLMASYWWIGALVLCVVLYKLILRVFFGLVIVPEDKIGLVTKKFVLFGEHKELTGDRIIAVNGEAGLQAEMLSPGGHKYVILDIIEMSEDKIILDVKTLSTSKRIGLVSDRHFISLEVYREFQLRKILD